MKPPETTVLRIEIAPVTLAWIVGAAASQTKDKTP